MYTYRTLLAVVLALLVGASAFAQNLPGQSRFGGTVIRILDGDSIEVMVVIWPTLTVKTIVRIDGIDTPEMTGAKCAEERAKGLAARDFVVAEMPPGTPVTLEYVHPDKYGGRVDAIVSYGLPPDVQYIGERLIAAGLAVPYFGGTRRSWCP